jgi:hypothetical protein
MPIEIPGCRADRLICSIEDADPLIPGVSAEVRRRKDCLNELLPRVTERERIPFIPYAPAAH